MLKHMTDERRSTRPKSARRVAVALGSPPDIVASLAGAISPCGAALLAGKLPKAIPMPQSY